MPSTPSTPSTPFGDGAPTSDDLIALEERMARSDYEPEAQFPKDLASCDPLVAAVSTAYEGIYIYIERERERG